MGRDSRAGTSRDVTGKRFTLSGLSNVPVVAVAIHRLGCRRRREHRLDRHDQKIAQSFADEMRAGRVLIDGRRRWRVMSCLGAGERGSGGDGNGKQKYALTHEVCSLKLVAGRSGPGEVSARLPPCNAAKPGVG